MPEMVGGKKDGMWIAPAVAGGELRRQLAKVGQRTLLRTWKQRPIWVELYSALQAKGRSTGQAGQEELRVLGAWESSPPNSTSSCARSIKEKRG